MNLGHRIKQARLEAGLSQRQLCGDVITRNMLSQIENGSANPSMDTLRYLAQQLEKPISFFLEETVPSSNQDLMRAAQAAFAAGTYADAAGHLTAYRSPDPIFDGEFHLLSALTLLQQAEQQSDPNKCRAWLEQAAEHGAQTPYYTPELERRRLLRLYQIAPEECVHLAQLLPNDDRELLLRAQAALKSGDYCRCICLLEAAGDQSAAPWLLLRGDAAMNCQDPQRALECYRQAETISPTETYPRLERYYKETEDYKMAYYYACKQR